MDAHLLAVLLSWTVSLSPYEHPGEPPSLEFKPHQFFIEHACGGVEKCRVLAWYDNNGTIFVDQRLYGNTDANTRSVIVHELAHYLQDLSGEYGDMNCNLYAKREREAHSIQRQYLNRIAGRFTVNFTHYAPCTH